MTAPDVAVTCTSASAEESRAGAEESVVDLVHYTSRSDCEDVAEAESRVLFQERPIWSQVARSSVAK